jgi:hypothetical protein
MYRVKSAPIALQPHSIAFYQSKPEAFLRDGKLKTRSIDIFFM